MKGSCLCKKITFEVSEFDENIANCHCSMCRKFHGAAYGTYATAKSMNWLTGWESIKIYKSSDTAERGFCIHCGSSIFYRLRKPNAPFEITLGTLDCEPDHPINAEIFCASKAKWSDFPNDLPKYAESRNKKK